MTNPVPGEPAPVTLQKAWARLMQNMGGLNLQRARDARRVANKLHTIRTKR